MWNFIQAGNHTFGANSDLSSVLCFQKMVLDLKFSRFEDQPWGFRLTGGSDFERPLTVIKVTAESLAETFGMKLGDVVVRVNDTPTSNLNHSEAHDVIMKCGNNFVLGILRPDDQDGSFYNGEDTNSVRADEVCSPYRQIQTPDSQAYSDMSEMTIETNRTESRSDDTKRTTDIISDEHIAELMSGEAEVLKEHNVLGVNFKKIIPKSGLFKSSEVFKHLNAEAIKTKQEKDNEVKRWTTFLQKPNRPIPKSKRQLEEERRSQLRYQIKICKQPKPRCDPNRTPTPVPPTPSPTPPSPVKNEPEAIPITEDILAQPEQEVELIPGPIPQYIEYLSEPEPIIEYPNETEPSNETNEQTTIITTEPDVSTKTDEELLIEKQLADVQKQLLALSTLPLTIQATIDAVTKQLSELIPTLNKVQQTTTIIDTGTSSTTNTIENLTVEENTKLIEENSETTEIELEKVCELQNDTMANVDDQKSMSEISQDGSAEEQENPPQNLNSNSDGHEELEESDDGLLAQEEIDKHRMEKVYRKQEEDWLNKREKELKRMEEEKLKMPRRLPKSQGGPLTPQNRPLVLPGGRKWRNERDAFNEDFIAEVISSQAELIMGQVLGSTYESPLLPYDDRVNFLKYKKPEKDLSNLNRSEVFKIIHHKEREPRHGIQVRPARVMAEVDVRHRATPISYL